jgi:two-component system cell cycle response regulator
MTMTVSPAGSQQRSLEIVPLADRLRWMLGVRVGVTVTPFAAWAADPAWRGTSAMPLLAPAVLLLGGALLTHPLTSRYPGWARRSITLLAILDTLYLDWALYLTGVMSGPVVHLIALQLVAVTLLVSFRTGMSLASCHSLTVMIILEAVGAGLLPRLPRAEGFEETRFSFFLVAIWLTTLTTASLAAVNERELRRRRYDEEVLRRFGMALHEADTGAKVAEALLDFTTQAADGSGTALYCRIGGHGDLPATELTARSRDGGPVEILPAADVPPPGSLLSTAVGRGRTMLAALRQPDPWVEQVLDGAAHVVVVPFAAERATGVLAFAHDARPGSRIEQRRVLVVEQAVAHAATAFPYALVENLQASAMTDGLTGVANRRAFDAALDRELSVAERNGSSVAVILVDLDHFKSLNDRFGHLAGDAVLKGVGAALRSCLRQGTSSPGTAVRSSR